jgi:hypothetical protein
MLSVSKAKFIVGAIAFVAIGGTTTGFAYDIATDECAQAPDGTFHWELLDEGFAHFIDRETACDPWQVVAPDPEVVSMTIGFTSGWNFEPSRQVRIAANGDITVLEPTDEMGMQTREIARANNPALVQELLGSLSRFTRYNRLPDKLPEGADLSDPQTYMTAPVMHCTGEIFDGGSASVQLDLRQRANQVAIFDSSCASIAHSQARDAFYEAHRRGFVETGFKGDIYIEGRKGS